MRCGERKIDRDSQKAVNKMVKSGRWEAIPGRKHLKLILKGTQRFVTVAGSSGDHRAALNFMKLVNKVETEAGFTTTTF